MFRQRFVHRSSITGNFFQRLQVTTNKYPSHVITNLTQVIISNLQLNLQLTI